VPAVGEEYALAVVEISEFKYVPINVNEKVPTDGLWIVALGTKGFLGLILLYLVLVLTAVLFLWRFPPSLWQIRSVAPATLAATLLCLYMVDCILNGFINIVYISLAGAVIGATPARLGVGVTRVNGTYESHDREIITMRSYGRSEGLASLLNEARFELTALSLMFQYVPPGIRADGGINL
jgi:hypothetical protein